MWGKIPPFLGNSRSVDYYIGPFIFQFIESTCLKKYSYVTLSCWQFSIDYNCNIFQCSHFPFSFHISKCFSYCPISADTADQLTHSNPQIPVKDEPREFQFWVSNSQNSSFVSMAIKGQQIYR